MNRIVTGGALWNPNQASTTWEEEWDPRNPPAGWVCVDQNESWRRWECDLGDGRIICKTEDLRSEQLLEQNKSRLNDSEGQRWETGREFFNCPMPMYYKLGLHEANKQRDVKYMRKIWNDPDYRAFRTFKGTV
jgi:hypothetical protein